MFLLKKIEFQNFRLSFLLLACVILGGTSQYVYTYKLPLYIISLVMIGLILSSRNKRKIGVLLIPPTILLLFFMGLFIIYLVPLSPDIWTSLKGRQIVEEGYILINEPLPKLPISLSPEKTFLSIFDFLPVVAVGLITILTKNIKELEFAVYSLLLISIVSVLLGMAQLIDGNQSFSLYKFFNKGRPIGFFSNTNHFICLLVMTMPLSLLLFFHSKNDLFSSSYGKKGKFLCAVSFLSGICGVLMAGSIAGYLLLILCILACIVIFNPKYSQKKTIILLGIIFILLILLDFFIFSGQVSRLLDKFSNTMPTSRVEIHNKVLDFRGNYGRFGIGPGAFLDIYPMHLESNSISTTYVNNAHNDFLQIWTEFGHLGVLLILSFFVWYFLTFIDWFKERKNRSNEQFIFLFSLILPILHSTVDFPLRTISISVIFTFLIVLVYRKRPKRT